MAMATTTSASLIGTGIRHIPEPTASVLPFKQNFASSQNTPVANAVRLAMARQGAGQMLFHGAAPQHEPATASAAPSILPNGIAPLDGTENIIQSGELVTIFGKNLASGTFTWKGNFPTSLGGTSVEIDNKPAYLMYVSPGQINLQAPDDKSLGTVSVVVTTAHGRAKSFVTLSKYAPAFTLLEVPKNQARFVSGIIIRQDGRGAFGKGKDSYDILGPSGISFGYPTVPAQEGDTIQLFGVGFGPTNPNVPAGKPFSGTAPIKSSFYLYINNIYVKPTFVGLTSAGLFQINLTVPPGLGEGEVSIQAMVGGMQTQADVFFSLPVLSTYPGTGGTVGGTPGVPIGGTGGTGILPVGGTGGGGATGGGGGGTGGGGTGGGGGSGGGSGDVKHKPYSPKLRFPSPSSEPGSKTPPAGHQ